MKITQDDSSILKVEEKHTGIIIISGVIFLFSIGYTIYLVTLFGDSFQEYIHWIFITGIMAMVVKSFCEKVLFMFNKREKTILWGRKSFYSAMKHGEIPFKDVEDVRIGFKGSQAVRKYRIEMTVKGESFPMSDVYTQGKRAMDTKMEVARRMKEVLGLPME